MSGKLKQLSALVFAAVLLAAGPAHAAQDWLKQTDITYVFAGREVKGVYQNGATFSEIYRKTGKIEYKDDINTLTGKWSIKDDQFCTLYEGQPGGCYKINLLSTNCFEYWLLQPTGEIDKSWIARSWQAKYPSTCPAFTPSQP
jgi:hypothetical protein